MSLSVLLGICAVLFLIEVAVVVVFLVKTLIQLRQTAKSIQTLAENINAQSLQLKNVTGAIGNVAGLLGGTAGKTAAFVFSVVSSLLRRSPKNGPEPSPDISKAGR